MLKKLLGYLISLFYYSICYFLFYEIINIGLCKVWSIWSDSHTIYTIDNLFLTATSVRSGLVNFNVRIGLSFTTFQ